MAPRRGGGSSGGGSSSSSSSSSKCSGPAFSSQAAQIAIAFHALFFLVFCGLFCVAAFKLIRSKQKGVALRRWFPLGLSITFMVVAVMFLIVLFTLLQCDIASVTVYQLVGLVPTWLIPVAHFLLIAVIMIPICKRLLQGNRKIAKMVTTVHTGYIVVLGIVLLCYLAIFTHLIDTTYRTGARVSSSTLRLHQRRLATAYYALSVIGMLMAAANMLFALVRGRHLRRGILLPAIVLLVLSSLGMTALNLANHIIIDYLQRELLRKGVAAFNRSMEAQTFLKYFFYAATFLTALLVASSKQLSDNASTGPVTHLPNQPKYYPQQPYRAYQPQPQPQSQTQQSYR
ncbi:integral membrane protein [Aspergillus bombycis]|uniref:Integral membrane protein n=1 Tax=Aspergillus bombycis TaxID=109264 RepID=A0A1F8A721_9EURO|nr:integral membrane protein [Aspergillus bombycis]OGM47506.1 integral membrane protein [Aspergillus bombycis]